MILFRLVFFRGFTSRVGLGLGSKRERERVVEGREGGRGKGVEREEREEGRWGEGGWEKG